ncbi:MAG: hypothetical protein LBL43_05565 [Treponema sp.]|nr:hypothetical protein [Treponema sp.]
MKNRWIAAALGALALLGCGVGGPILLTPRNQAGTRSVVLLGNSRDGEAPSRAGEAPEAGVLQTLGPAEPLPPAERPRSAPAGDVLEIREKMFIAQTNEVYLNPEDYMGRTVKLEGLFKKQEYPGGGGYCFVLRYGPGCCGNDGSAGFEVAWDRPYPQEDEWVEAVGVLDSYDEDGYPYLYLDLASLVVKEERGKEFVTQ